MSTLTSLDLIENNPWQPRQAMDPTGLEELALSIAREGLMQVPVARKVMVSGVNDFFQLAIGHRRLEAFRMLARIQADILAGNSNGWRPELVDLCKGRLKDGKQFDRIPLEIEELTDRQMFERAVQENLQRKDLNPIEQAAAMKRYMDEFNVSSEVAGAFFGVSGSTIRGTVRLLELPEKARDKVASKEMNFADARALLGAAKILPPEGMDRLIDKVLKGEATPYAFEFIHRDYKNIIYLYQQNEKSNPVAGRDLWELNQKKFPTWLLPPLNSDGNPEISKAIKAGHFNHLMAPPACTACDFYIKMVEKHYCGLKICWDRKKIAFERSIMQQKSEEWSIPILSKADGEYLVLTYGNYGYFDKRDEGLRLALVDQINAPRGFYGQYISNCQKPEFLIIVLTGKSFEKIKQKKHEERVSVLATNKEGRSQEDQYKKTLSDRKELVWDTTVAFSHLFDNLPSDALYAFCSLTDHETFAYRPGALIPPDDDFFMRRVIALAMIMQTLVDEDGHEIMAGNITTMARAILELAKECKVNLPDNFLDRARAIEPEPVSTETEVSQ